MKAKRFTGLTATIAMTAASWLGASGAAANTVPFSGSASVEVPPSPAGEMSFTLTVNGQEHEFSNVDNSLGGELTFTWTGSQEEPRVTTQSCPGGAPGAQILIEEATPSATVWATWVSPTSQELIGPVQVPSRPGFASASVCDGPPPDEDQPVEDPPAEEDPDEDDEEGEDEGDPETEEPEDQKAKKEKKVKSKPKK
jgi:hypothetical protein